ncbi:MAG: GMC family oxidoreductase N-terminal domain-containing protein, partial [Cypionkella sp.]
MSYDYIIVGSGPSGCVTAARLVRDHGAKVLLLEAGPRNSHPLLHMPAGFIKMLSGSRYLSFQETTPQAQLGGRVHLVPQGHVLGGGSSVNAMVYMRGRPSDYEGWNAAAAGSGVGWGWDDVLPLFRHSEDFYKGADELHGSGGEWRVERAPVR